jgi:serine/threonine-protein kinase RIM15
MSFYMVSHLSMPEKVFENILSGCVEWHKEGSEFSARDFMQRLMTLDPGLRLGAV